MKHAKVAAGFAVLTLSVAGLAVAQPAEEAPQVNRRVQAQVDRMMANDKNGDAKLDRDELPARLAERLFVADADQDGSLTREELIAHFSGQAPAGAPAGDAATDRPAPPSPGGAAAAGAGRDTFEGAMKQAGGAMRALRGSEFAPGTRDSDLDAVQSVQEAMVTAKASYRVIAMSPRAAEQFGADEAAYQSAFRVALIESLRAAIDLELAVLEGDPQAAMAARNRLMESQKTAHDLFQE